MINLQPTIIGKLIKLRPLLSSDFDNLHKVASDKLIWQQHPDPRRCQRQYFREKFFNPALQWQSSLIIQNHNNQIKGSSRYYFYRPQYKDITIGYTFMSRDCWGTNINKELKYLMMSYIFNWVDIAYFNVGQNNFRSRKATQKLGTNLLSEDYMKQKNIVMPALTVTYQMTKQAFNKSKYFNEVK